MLKLTIFPPALNLRSASPFSIKAELFLKISGLDYRTLDGDNPARTPNGKYPIVEDKGNIIADSHYIYMHLVENHGFDIHSHLSDEEWAIGLAYTRLIEDHLYWANIYARWEDPDFKKKTVKELMSTVPFPTRILATWASKSKTRTALYHHGLLRHSKEKIYEKGVADLTSIAHQLGDTKYFLGDQISSFDGTVYAILVAILYPDIDSPLKQYIKSNQKLVDYVKRIEDEYDFRHPA